MAKFATGVIDTGGKFAAGVVDIGGKFATWTCEYLHEFPKKFEMTLMFFFRGLGEGDS